MSWLWQRTGALTAMAAMLAAGCQPWPKEQNPFTTTDPATDFGHAINEVYLLVTWITLVIFVAIFGLMIFILYRFRDDGSKGNPKQVHGSTGLEIGWTLVPIAIVIVILVPTLRTLFELGDSAPKDAMQVRVVGKRWWWEFQYIEDGKSVTAAFATANELHLPAGRDISLLLESDSVIHSFWAPRLGGKRDAVPGRTNRIHFNIEEQPTPGNPIEYRGECAEYCGESHGYMRFRVYAHTPEDFEAWVQDQLHPPEPQMDASAQSGKELFTKYGCVGCHTVRGNDSAKGRKAPDLTLFGRRVTLGAATVDNTDEHLRQWIRDPNSIKPGMTEYVNQSRGPGHYKVAANDGMNILQASPDLNQDGVLDWDVDENGVPDFTDQEVNDLAAYLRSLQ